MKLLRHALGVEPAQLDVSAQSTSELYTRIVDRAEELGLLPNNMREATMRELVARESEAPSAIGYGVAVPHVYLDDLQHTGILFFRLKEPLHMGSVDGSGVRYVFFLVGPSRGALDHLHSLAAIARVMSDDAFRYALDCAENADDLVAALDSFVRRDRDGTSQPPSQDPLEPTGQLFGGVRRDLQRRLPHYLSDLRDGLHSKTLSAIGFMFFACLAPTVTFGGVMAERTGGAIGVAEMLVATGIGGVVYSLLSGQPLIILGGTGPMLVCTVIIYEQCQRLGLPFLPVYAWIGLWTSLILIILAALDICALMRWFTRFTDEIFAGLISLIFLFEALSALRATFSDPTVPHESSLLTLVLALGTLYLGYTLSRFRNSRFLGPRLREFLADFGPTIALVLMSMVALRLGEVALTTLEAPDSIGTTSGRPWLVPLDAIPLQIRLAAAVPALLVSVLVYLDQNITARIVNSPDRHLRKGAGYHLDLVVISCMVAACSLFGLPWLVAATVRSLNHLHSLTTERGVHVVHVRETRVTGFVVHALIAASLLALPLLKLVPMAVLYGLFLMMGINSIHGNQFLDRVKLWITDPERYPPHHYIGRIPMASTRRYTLVQAVCLSVLWLVKVSPLSVLFPLFIAALVPVRLWIARWFPKEVLAELDAEAIPKRPPEPDKPPTALPPDDTLDAAHASIGMRNQE
ncbi:MAG: PTS sugar transporter subunit IIA [Myxococcales bacterium]|nr:PTS sugar transporter subunit IIA [Myxococcales bacterium]